MSLVNVWVSKHATHVKVTTALDHCAYKIQDAVEVDTLIIKNNAKIDNDKFRVWN
jgi:hypothetical protein